jgi:hypothetical protein
MRAAILTLVGVIALAAVSAQATPFPPNPLGPVIYMPNQKWAPLPNDPPRVAPVGAVLPAELVAQGCGRGWHRGHWRDRWGPLALGPLRSEWVVIRPIVPGPPISRGG